MRAALASQAVPEANRPTFDAWWQSNTPQQKAAIGDWRDAEKGWDAAMHELASQVDAGKGGQ